MRYAKNMIDEYVESFENAIAEMVQDIEHGLLFWDIIECFAEDEINGNLLEYGIIESAETYGLIIDVLYDYLNDNGILYFVMRKDHGVKSMIKELESKYNVTIVNKDKGFYIVSLTKHL